MLTQEYLKSKLIYNPETGLFTNKKGKVLGHYDKDGYLRITLNGKIYRTGKLAVLYMTGKYPNMVDHINRIRDNNRYINLRVCDYRQNSQNCTKPKNNTSGFPGLSLVNKGKQYLCLVQANGIRYNKCFSLSQKDDAIAWIINKRLEVQKEFCPTNLLEYL